MSIDEIYEVIARVQERGYEVDWNASSGEAKSRLSAAVNRARKRGM